MLVDFRLPPKSHHFEPFPGSFFRTRKYFSTYYYSMPNTRTSTKFIPWTGKGTAYRLWLEINKYVEEYAHVHPQTKETAWYKRWSEVYSVGNLAAPAVSLQVATAFLIQNPKGTIKSCLDYLFDLILDLSKYLLIL